MKYERFDPLVKICENLSFNLTLFERKGCCQKPESNCKYNRTNLDSSLHFCHKKTYTPDLPLLRPTG